MANIEITDNTIIRSLIRKGSDADRKRTTLAQGELGYTTDTNRVFIGDGITAGGSATGNKFLGTLNSFADAINLGIQPGDLIKVGTGLYARNADGTGSDNDASGYTECGLSGTLGAGLSLDSSSNINVNVDGTSIIINGNDEIALGDVSASNLPIVDSNSIIGNPTGTAAHQVSINVDDNNVLGRVAGSNIRSISFDDIIENADAPNLASARVRNLAAGATGVVYADSSGNLTRTPPPATNSKNNFQSIVGNIPIAYWLRPDNNDAGGGYNTGASRNQILSNWSLTGKDVNSRWRTIALGSATDTNSYLRKFLESAGVTSNFEDYNNINVNAISYKCYNKQLYYDAINAGLLGSWAEDGATNYGEGTNEFNGKWTIMSLSAIANNEYLSFTDSGILRVNSNNTFRLLFFQSQAHNSQFQVALTGIYFS